MNKMQEEYPLLVAQEGPLKGQRWPVSQTIVLGREFSCDVVVADRQISRFHARLTPTPEGVILEDLGSKNGTHHNGVPLTGPVVLQDGDLLSVALAQQFLFLTSDATMPSPRRSRAPRTPDDGSEIPPCLGKPAAARSATFGAAVQNAVAAVRKPGTGCQPSRSCRRGVGR